MINQPAVRSHVHGIRDLSPLSPLSPLTMLRTVRTRAHSFLRPFTTPEGDLIFIQGYSTRDICIVRTPQTTGNAIPSSFDPVTGQERHLLMKHGSEKAQRPSREIQALDALATAQRPPPTHTVYIRKAGTP